MAGKARIEVFWPKAEEHNGPAQASAVDPDMRNKANCLRLWAKNAGRAENKANFPGLLGGGTMR